MTKKEMIDKIEYISEIYTSVRNEKLAILNCADYFNKDLIQTLQADLNFYNGACMAIDDIKYLIKK